MLYSPHTQRPDPSIMGMYKPEIAKVVTEDGLTLEGWYFPPENKEKPVLVFFHGNAGDISHRGYKAIHYLEKGYGVLLAEYRGFGGNSGDPSEQGFYKDARAFLKYISVEQKIPVDQIILYGESIGTGVAVQMASEISVAGVVLEASYSSTVDVAANIYFYFPVKYLMKDQFRSVEKIQTVSAPLLFIHGGKDRTIPLWIGEKLFEAANDPKKFINIPEAGHNDLYEYGSERYVLDFLSAL